LHAHASEIADANDIALKDGVDAGDELAIPVSAAVADHPQRYTVRKGDTLVTVADRFGVTVSELRQWNRMTARSVAPGKTLYVSQPVRLAPATRVRKSRRGSKSTAGKARSGMGRTVAAKKPATSKKGSKPAAKKPAAKRKSK
jgi:membrane-bound lytic murein transglycosylase D